MHKPTLRKFAITYPRSGSHLMGKAYGLKDWAARETNPDPSFKALTELIAKLNLNIWVHYYYSPRLVWTLEESGADCYILLRDPRDIIVSLAHYVEDRPDTFPNFYYLPDEKLSDYPFTERIDILIAYAFYDMLEYELYRQCDIFKPIYYEDLLKLPDAQIYTKYKVRGIVGAYKDEMTPEQIRCSSDRFEPLIEAWRKRGHNA